MILSKRLLALASLVEPSKKVFDIGCDHGLLSIYLAKDNNNTVIASDITQFSVNTAIENVKKAKVSSKVKVIKTDGLNNLKIKSDDIIILAGMGTHTIINILNSNITKLSDTIIIQSNNSHNVLRKKMHKLGYYIDNEMAIVDGKYYLLVKFKKGKKRYKMIDYILGPIIRKNDKIYVKSILNRYQKLDKSIPYNKILKKIKFKYIIWKIKRELAKF